MPPSNPIIKKQAETHRTTTENQQLQTQLLWQVSSREAGVAIAALNTIRQEGWFDLLSGATLGAVRWYEANLEEFDLSGADMSNTLLHHAYLRHTNLSHATLVNTNLQGAYLVNADLQGASMGFANLSHANLRDANLEQVHFDRTIFDAQTMLPNGLYWTATTDMTCFTDPHQKAFWRSPKPDSPAYRGINKPV